MPGERWEEQQLRKGEWKCEECNVINFRKRDTCKSCGAEKRIRDEDELPLVAMDNDRDEEELEAALLESSAAHEREEREEEERLAAILEESRREELDRATAAESDREALEIALELSKQQSLEDAERENRELEAALEISTREEESRRAYFATEHLGPPPPGIFSAPPREEEKFETKTDSFESGVADYKERSPSTTSTSEGTGPAAAAKLLTPQQVVRGGAGVVVEEESEDMELALHLSEQVESLERVLDDDEDEETLAFALAASALEARRVP